MGVYQPMRSGGRHFAAVAADSERCLLTKAELQLHAGTTSVPDQHAGLNGKSSTTAIQVVCSLLQRLLSAAAAAQQQQQQLRVTFFCWRCCCVTQIPALEGFSQLTRLEFSYNQVRLYATGSASGFRSGSGSEF
jgi:hypothetical protein